MNKNNNINNVLQCCVLALFACMLSQCAKDEVIGADPYAGGRQSLGVSFTNALPFPESGPAGSEVTFFVKGLKAWKDSFSFYLNGELSTVLETNDSTVKIRIPDNVSSGNATVQLKGQVFFGPRFTVIGNIAIDPGFSIGDGSNGPIYAAAEFNLGYFLAGSFTSFEKRNINNIALIDKQGVYSGYLSPGKGANGSLYSVSQLANGKFIVSGNFSSYNGRNDIGNITRLNGDGSLDQTIVSVINPTPETPRNGLDTVPSFNGGSPFSSIIKSFVTADNKVIAVGNFKNHSGALYAASTRQSRQFSLSKVNTVMRMNENGVLDSTYNFSVAGDKAGANDIVNDAWMETNGMVVIAGNFTSFNGIASNRIIRIDNEGNPDATFNTGSGANGPVNKITYNAVQKRFMLTGNFTMFNGKPSKGVVMLKEDGALDESFIMGDLTGGTPGFATVLNSGKVLVSGNFQKYDNVTRSGFLILNSNGSASQENNVPGSFEGQIQQVIESTSSYGKPALVLIGFIRKFDDKPVNNILRIEISN